MTRDDTTRILAQLGQELRWARIELARVDAENRAELRKRMGLERSERAGGPGMGLLREGDEQDAGVRVESLSRQPAFGSPRRGLQLVGRISRRADARNTPHTERAS